MPIFFQFHASDYACEWIICQLLRLCNIAFTMKYCSEFVKFLSPRNIAFISNKNYIKFKINIMTNIYS